MAHATVNRIACALCVGSAREPYLAATLASIATAVDVLVINDNSSGERSHNVRVAEASAFSSDGRLRVARRTFVDFAHMRNDAHAMLCALDPPPEWVLFLDADEVHGEQVRYVAREVLPRLGPDVGEVDAYTYHFWGTFGWITDIARRMAFYRFAPDLHWENAVHEKIRGLRGRAIALPYIYHHYGNVLHPRMLAEKHQRYYGLGNPVPAPPSPEDATVDVYLARAADVRPYRRPHPAVARDVIAALTHENAAAFAELDEALRSRRSPPARLRNALQGANESLRVRLRALQHPGLFRAPMVAK